MKKVLLLNPPGKKYYMRDYYCSKISKAVYYYHPIDFIVLSGILSKYFEIYVMDCIAERMNQEMALKEILHISPDIIIFLSGTVSMETDFPFLAKVKLKTSALMIGIGDIFLDYAKELLRNNYFIDAVLLDFTTNDIVAFLNDKNSAYQNIIYKERNQIIERKEVHSSGVFSISRPRHELFKNNKYNFPFSGRETFATVITDFGCPFSCSYCVVNRFGYKERKVEDVIEELSFINMIGIKEIVFKDQTFAANTLRAKLLCEEIFSNKIEISWTCFSRAELIEENLLAIMKKAGCHTIIFGIESSNRAVLSRFDRYSALEKIKETFSLCRGMGIETVGTFIIGLPGDNRQSIERTIVFSKEIGCDFASFNIFTPAHGTKIRNTLIKESVIENKLFFMDSGISYPSVETGLLKRSQIWRLRKKAIVSFYIRPMYAIEKIKQCHSFFEIRNMLKQAFGILRSLN